MATGQLTSVSNANSATTFTTFDVMGKLTASKQATGTQTYPFTYAHNLASELVSETYPSGRTVTNGFDAAQRISSVTGSFGGQATNYISTAVYWPHGAPNYYVRGNTLWSVSYYNSRLQPVLNYEYLNNNGNQALALSCLDWGTETSYCGAYTASPDNGVLKQREEYAGGPGTLGSLPEYTQTFGYDGVNRLTSASDTGGFSQSFSYDAYGNLWLPSSSGLPAYGPMPSSNIYNSNNRNPNLSYNGAGSQTSLGSMTLAYNAEQQQTSATNTLGGGTATYQYDGLGERVVKTIGSQTEVYVYDAFGQLAAEYESQPVAGPPCLTCYLSYDHLGSVTLVTDQNGNAVARHDYAPFGQEVPGGSAGRSALFGSTTDVDPKFTGQLRDTETNEDYFNARYHFAQQMRFMSPDPANAGADITNPQSWNAYAYVLGNPLGMVDPSGMDEVNYSGIPNGGCAANHQGSDFCGSVSTGPFSPMPPGVYDASLAILPTGLSPGTPPPTSPAAGSAPTTPAKNVSNNAWVWAATGTHAKVHGLWTYGNWCGIGGSGSPTDDLDAACLNHDYCYAAQKLTASGNLGGANAALQSCNQALCNSAWAIARNPYAPLGERQASGDVRFYFGGANSNGNGGVGVTGLISRGNACQGPY